MQLVLHTGAHFTEEERLMKCLLRNATLFRQRGVAVPGPSKYRKLLKDILNALQTAPASEGARDVLLDAILDEDEAERVILSHPHIFGAPRGAVHQGMIFHTGPERMRKIRSCSPMTKSKCSWQSAIRQLCFLQCSNRPPKRTS